jgi:hypothetical protein
MSGMGDIQPIGDLNFVPQPAVWGSVTAGDNLHLFDVPDYQVMRIDFAALTIRYRWEDMMTEAELQYGNVTTGDRGAILAISAVSQPSFTEFVYQQRYYVQTECAFYCSKGPFLQGLYLDSATSNPLGGISFVNCFVAYSLAYGAPGVL